jgi:ATP-dependent DNA helicase RecG
MEAGELRQLINQGEGPTVEFKREFTTAIDREMAGLANAGGGVVFVGVADDSTIVGVDDPKGVADRVMGLCRTNIKPPLTPNIETVEVEGENVLVIGVGEGSQKPYTANGICYVRAGATTRRAHPEELRRLSFDTAYTAYERIPVAGTAIDDLNLAKLQDYVEYRAPGSIRINGVRASDVALSWGLVRRIDGERVPTVAGLMLFGLEPQRVHPQWGLGALRVSGVELTDPIVDRADFEGTADLLIEQGLDFVRRNMRVAALFGESNTGRRRDVPEYPLEAVREVITNAVAHRDYSSTGRVQLRMFEDRLEVGNPGGLPADLTLEEVTQRGGASYARNPTIARVLRDWGYMEEVGRGLLRIQRLMQELGSEAPIFESTPARFTVTLPSRHKTLG